MDYTHEVKQIADRITALAEKKDAGVVWKTPSYQTGKGVQYGEQTSIYSGSAGIILFLLQAAKQLHTTAYDSVIIQATDVLAKNMQRPTDFVAFISGRVGEIYVLNEVFKYFKKPEYRQIIDSSLKDLENNIDRETINEYINGRAGTALALLQLYHNTPSEHLLSMIDTLLGKIIHGIYLADKGIYWDRSGNNVKGLCGFSHGASGIAFLLLELGKYFHNQALLELAEEAFIYEDEWYSEEQLNWADWRKGIWDEKTRKEYEEAYEKNDIAFFTQPKYMNAWCHGAAGIGLARISAYEILKKEKYQNDASKVVARIEKDDPLTYRSYTLCHGGASNAEAHLLMYEITKDNQYLLYPGAVAQEISKKLKKNEIFRSGIAQAQEEDPSLFMGISGVGYFLLRVMNPFHIPSILCPRITSPGKQADDAYRFLTISKEEIEAIKKEKRELYAQPFVRRIEDKVVSDAYTNYKQVLQYQKANVSTTLADEEFDCLKLSWGEYAIYEERDGAHHLIKYTPEQVVYLEVSEFCARVMKHFKHVKTVHSVVQALCTEYKAEGEKEKEYVAHQAREQIKQLMLYGALE